MVVVRPPTTTDSVLTCGPSTKRSTITRPVGDSASATAKAHAASMPGRSRTTPRAPRLSTGFTTRRPSAARWSRSSCATLSTRAYHGTGTPARTNASFIASLSDASSAVSTAIPGSPSACATAATVIGTSAAAAITPSMRFALAYARAASTVASRSYVLARSPASAYRNPGASCAPSDTSTRSPIRFASSTTGTASRPPEMTSSVRASGGIGGAAGGRAAPAPDGPPGDFRSSEMEPSVHVERLPGAVRGLLRGEEHDRARHLVGLAEPAEEDRVADRGREPRQAGRRHLGGDQAGRDAVRADAARGEEAGHALREGDEAALRRGVVRGPRAAVLPAHGADVHDGAARAEPAERLLRHDERAAEVHGEHLVPVGVGDPVEVGRLVDAGVVHEDVDPAERPGERLEAGAHARAVADVERRRRRGAAGRADLLDHGRRRGRLRHPGDADGRALGGARARDRPPDAAAGARDDDPPSVEPPPPAHATRRLSFARTSRRAAAATSSAPSPKCCASTSGSPDAPKRSRTPTRATGTGQRSASASATAPPRPPITEWSSAVTTAPVRSAEATRHSTSSGLSVGQLTTRARMPSRRSAVAAAIVRCTMVPHATSVTSEPSSSTCALPTAKRWSAPKRTGSGLRPVRR